MTRCLVVVSIAAFSGGWGVYVEEDGSGLVLHASLPPPGRTPGLWARERAIAIGPEKAAALFALGAGLEIPTTTRPLRPDEPIISVTLRGANGPVVERVKPAGVPVPSLDPIVERAHAIARGARSEIVWEGPLPASWRPWVPRAT